MPTVTIPTPEIPSLNNMEPRLAEQLTASLQALVDRYAPKPAPQVIPVQPGRPVLP